MFLKNPKRAHFKIFLNRVLLVKKKRLMMIMSFSLQVANQEQRASHDQTRRNLVKRNDLQELSKSKKNSSEFLMHKTIMINAKSTKKHNI